MIHSIDDYYDNQPIDDLNALIQAYKDIVEAEMGEMDEYGIWTKLPPIYNN